jgi:hypothetical protein
VKPIVGDWNGDGKDTAGYYNTSDASWHLSNSTVASGPSDLVYIFGPVGDSTIKPVAADWNGDGRDTAGWYRPSDASWHLNNSTTPTGTNITTIYGEPGNAAIVPLAGDWDGYSGSGLSGQAAAEAALASGRLTGDTEAIAQIEGIASGQPRSHVVNGAVRTCFIDSDILNFLKTAVVDRGYSIRVSSINRYCIDQLTDSGISSYHWRNGGGHAVDISRLNGVGATGGTLTAERNLIALFGSTIAGAAGVGQVQCRASIALPANIVQFNDGCDHLHFESRT